MRVGVYGSLREGMGNHYLLDGSIKLGTIKIKGQYKMVHLGAFPGLVKSTEPTPVTLEVYSINADTLCSLDHLEGHPHFYKRERVNTKEHGKIWVYFLPEKYKDHPQIPSGDWVTSKEI